MLVVGALGCAAVLMLLWSRSPAAPAAHPAIESLTENFEDRASGGASDVEQPAAPHENRDAPLRPRCRVFVYERVTQPHDACLPFLLKSSTDASLAEIRDLASNQSDDAYLVLDLNGRRVSLATADLHGYSNEYLRSELQAAGATVRFRVEDAETHEPMTALLIDSAGRPFGPIERDPQPLVVDAGFEGRAFAADCAPASFHRLGSHAIAYLRRAAWVRGRVTGVPFLRGTLKFRGLPQGGHPQFALDVGIDAEGTFAIGPVPTGRNFLGFDCDDAWLVKSDRQVDLRPGRQDLGVLRLQPLHVLHVRFVRDGRDYSGDLMVSLTLQSRKLDGIPVTAYPIEHGRLVLKRFRADRAAIRAWTQDGYLGESDGVLAERTSEAAPLTLTLQAPGSIVAHATTDPFELPAGSAILAYPTAYHRDRHALLRCREDRPDQRVRRFSVPSNGVVSIDRLWPGSIGLALISPNGTLLASDTVHVVPGSTGSVTLRPAVSLAALDIRGPATCQRFALTGETSGVVARARATAQITRILVPPGRYDLQTLTDNAVGPRQTIELAAGKVRTLLID